MNPNLYIKINPNVYTNPTRLPIALKKIKISVKKTQRLVEIR